MVFRFLVFSIYKNPKSNHHLLFLVIFLDLEMLQFWSVNYTFILDMSSNLDNIYIWVFLVNCESVLLLAFVKYMLYRHCTENCIYLYFLEAKSWKSSYLCVFSSTIDSRKTSITQEQLVVESCPALCWIAFLMLCQLVYNICGA